MSNFNSNDFYLTISRVGIPSTTPFDDCIICYNDSPYPKRTPHYLFREIDPKPDFFYLYTKNKKNM
jgi:hypothetical protein